VKEAWEAALQAADKEDFIFVGGSSYVVGEFLELQDIIDY
jgi:folylpolyglutamate synthase/dihydropteroate synthase